MRYSTSGEFSWAREQHRIAYAAHDAFAKAGDDNSPPANAAGDAEYAALLHMLTLPATHPGDIAGKLAAMRYRDIDAGWTDWYPQIMASITADCARMTRDCVSVGMAHAFDQWADLRRKVFAEYARAGHTDETVEAIDVERREAFLALTRMPLNAPGDWMVKTYTNGLEALGSTSEEGLGIFETVRDPNDANWGFGSCRRRPPVLIDGVVRAIMPLPKYGDQVDLCLRAVDLTTASLLPATHSVDWCGEFAATESEVPL